MKALWLSLGLALPVMAGCASVHREIPYTTVTEEPLGVTETYPIALGKVEVAKGGLFRPAIYWKPTAWRLLALPVDDFQEKVRRLIRGELDLAGFKEEAGRSHKLEVRVEELALFTRGRATKGYRQGYARLRFILRSPDGKVEEKTVEGEARFAGSRVRRSEGGSLFRSTYVYDRSDPKPLDYAIRLAVRSFLK